MNIERLLHLNNMKTPFLSLLMIISTVNAIAQPNDKLKDAMMTYNDCRSKQPPYNEEDCSDLLNSRDFLVRYISHPKLEDVPKIKYTFYLYKIQGLLLECNSLLSKDEIKSVRRDYYSYFKLFLSLDVDDKRSKRYWENQKKNELYLLDLKNHNLFQKSKEENLVDEFLKNPELQGWYKATIRNYSLDSLFVELEQKSNDSLTLKVLKSYKVVPDSSCYSIFSRYECDTIKRLIVELETKLEAQKNERELRLRHKKEIKKERLARGKNQLQKADSLLYINELNDALKMYNAAEHIPFEGNYASDCIREIYSLMWESFTYDYFLFDTIGRLRIDTTKRLNEVELKQIKDNRKEISTQIIRSLREYEDSLYASFRKEYRQSNGKVSIQDLLPYKIEDTTKLLYKLKCDSSGIINIEDSLLSNNKGYGELTDSIIRKVLPSIFPYLRIVDDQIHEYLIPIIYIPSRYKYPKRSSFYCNCQLPICLGLGAISCSYRFNVNSETQIIRRTSEELDEFFFVIREGQPISRD